MARGGANKMTTTSVKAEVVGGVGEVKEAASASSEKLGKSKKTSGQKRSFTDMLNGELIVFLVGTDEKSVTVSRELICNASEVFNNMLNGSFKEAKESSVKLPDDHADAFELFVQWIYRNQLDLNIPRHLGVVKSGDITVDKDSAVGPPIDGWREQIIALLRLYQLADKYCLDERLYREAFKCISNADRRLLYSVDIISTIYDLPERAGTPLRSCIVCAYLHNDISYSNRSMKQMFPDIEALPVGFVTDVADSLFNHSSERALKMVSKQIWRHIPYELNDLFRPPPTPALMPAHGTQQQ